MAIAFVAEAHDDEETALTPPEDARSGDLAVVWVGINSSNGYTAATPTGWTRLAHPIGEGSGGNPGGSTAAGLFVKILTGSDLGQPAVFAVSPGGANYCSTMSVYRGEGPLWWEPNAVTTLTTPAGLSIPLDSVDVTEDGLLITGALRKGGNQVTHTYTAPTTPSVTVRSSATRVSSSTLSIVQGSAPVTAGTVDVSPDWATTTQSNTSGIAFGFSIYEGEPPELLAPVYRKWTLSGWYPPRD